MAQTERKEVKVVGDQNNTYTSVSSSGAKVNGYLADGSTQGKIENLTMLGTGFNT